MRLGVHQQSLARSLEAADEVWLYAPPSVAWDVRGAMAPLGARAHVIGDMDELVRQLSRSLRCGDNALIMSNGGFGGLHARLLAALPAGGGA